MLTPVVNRSERELASFFDERRTARPAPKATLVEMPFGEFLVDKGVLSRADLFRALSEQDRQPGVPIGEVLSLLGLVSADVIEAMLAEFQAIEVVEV
jgi:hypothetical protein